MICLYGLRFLDILFDNLLVDFKRGYLVIFLFGGFICNVEVLGFKWDCYS